MHRTQLLLETWQVEALRARAEAAGISMSELVRRVVSAWLTPDGSPDPLDAVRGLAADGLGGDRHDDVLYGWSGRTP